MGKGKNAAAVHPTRSFIKVWTKPLRRTFFGPDHLRLRTKLVGLLIGVILPLGLISFLTTSVLYRSERDASDARLLQLAHTMMASVEGNLGSVVAAAQVLAISEELERGDFGAFRTRALKVLPTISAASIVLTAPSGAQLMNTAATELVSDEPARSALSWAEQKAFRNGEPQVSSLFNSQALRMPVVSVVVPVGKPPSVSFVLSVRVSASQLSKLIQMPNLPAYWTIGLVDHDGTVLARNRDQEKYVGHAVLPSIISTLALREDVVRDASTFEGQPIRTALAYSPTLDWSIAVGVPEQLIWSPIFLAITAILIVIAICLAGGIIAASHLAAGIVRANEQRDLLINELNHRVKNTLVTIQSLAHQTLRRAPDMQAAAEALEGRILALSNAHNVLTEESWAGADLAAIVAQALEPFVVERRRVTLDGPIIRLTPRLSLGLALVVHELATNAVKYGALSTTQGQVDFRWQVGDRKLCLEWKERGGPPAVAPERQGFGSVFIQGLMSELKGNATPNFDAGGVTWHLEFPLPAASR